MKDLIIIVLLISAAASVKSQSYRLKVDFTTKEKLSIDSFSFFVGKVYYDLQQRQVVYNLTFPEKEMVIIKENKVFSIRDHKISKVDKAVLIPEFTVFHLALTNQLSNYGLKAGEEQAVYKVGKVEKTSKGILTTWVPTEDRLKKLFGDIKMLKKDKRLDAMIFYDAKGKIVSRQFFKDYVNIKGVEFPQEVTMVSYDFEGKKNIQLTTYKNIQIDQNDEDNMYRYRIPISKSAGLKK